MRRDPLSERRPSLPPDDREIEAFAEGLTPWSYREALRGTGSLSAVSAHRSTAAARHRISPILGTAPHWCHHVRPALQEKMVIDDATRLYDEDPFTERFLEVVPHTVMPLQSRYEVDVNRPPHSAIYETPEMAWGEEVWEEPLGPHETETTMERWYEFHSFIDAAVADAVARYDRAVLLDIHSYNYQRDGATDWRDDDRPEINLGTGHLRLDDEGEDILDWVRDRLRGFTVEGETARFGENTVFYGGYINRRISHFFGRRCVTVSIEFKKVFMDERTGEPDPKVLEDLVAQTDDLVCDLGDRLGVPVRDDPGPVYLPDLPLDDPA